MPACSTIKRSRIRLTQTTVCADKGFLRGASCYNVYRASLARLLKLLRCSCSWELHYILPCDVLYYFRFAGLWLRQRWRWKLLALLISWVFFVGTCGWASSSRLLWRHHHGRGALGHPTRGSWLLTLFRGELAFAGWLGLLCVGRGAWGCQVCWANSFLLGTTRWCSNRCGFTCVCRWDGSLLERFWVGRSSRGFLSLTACFYGLSLLLVGRWATGRGLTAQICYRGLDLLFITAIRNRFLRRRFG